MSKKPIICPHCNHKLDGFKLLLDHNLITRDLAISDIECYNKDCGKKFRIVCSRPIELRVLDEDALRSAKAYLTNKFKD